VQPVAGRCTGSALCRLTLKLQSLSHAACSRLLCRLSKQLSNKGNILFTGKQGMFTSTSGLKLVYVSGTEEESQTLPSHHSFTDRDIESVKNICIRGQTNFKGVDILITSSWPKDITSGDKSCSVSNVPLVWPLYPILPQLPLRASQLTNWISPVAGTD
jgi:hypothetical protein